MQGLRRARHAGRRPDQRLRPHCGRTRCPREGWFDISTLKEPYRIEGKKTMGYEVAEQLGWELPDAIFYPTGGGVGMIGMWKAFARDGSAGLDSAKRPKMIAVQAEGCQPVVRAFKEGAERSQFWEGAATVASGLAGARSRWAISSFSRPCARAAAPRSRSPTRESDRRRHPARRRRGHLRRPGRGGLRCRRRAADPRRLPEARRQDRDL